MDGRQKRSLGSRLLSGPRTLIRLWSASLRVRVMTTTVAVGMIAVAVLGAVLSAQVRDGLFDDRRNQVLEDAATRAESAQLRFNSVIINNEQEVQQLANEVVQGLHQGPAASVHFMQVPGAQARSVLLPPVTDERLARLISPELRERVRDDPYQQWQSVAIPIRGSDSTIPGIAVGSTVTLPIAGELELYFIYSLESEEQTLTMLQQVLVAGAISLIGLLIVMAWYLARQVLDPVQAAARTASRLADGLLTERMPIRGRDELAVLGRTFNDMAKSLQDQIERLAELSQMQQRFVSDVSHELRTPLTTIRMAAEVLHAERDSFPPVQARSAELLATQVERFELLLSDLLEISRFDAGSAALEVEEIDLCSIVAHVVEQTGAIAEDRGSRLEVIADDVDATADVDRRRVERVLRNLVVNAIEHGESGPIEIRVGASDDAVSVRVRDFGIGMTAPEAERVFDRFWRADPARTRTLGGTGLGLAISLEDARLHGGTLEAWGSPGEGAAFRLTLPRRAGLEVVEHPLSLVPIRPEAPAQPRHTAHDPAGPATVPPLHDVEVTR